jgi:DNA-directed RNA polymerase subunit RPC12/RpoP
MNLKSTIKCPECGFEKEETMPLNYCQILYECTNCGAKITPKEGLCCVYCSYGTVKCPSQQQE